MFAPVTSEEDAHDTLLNPIAEKIAHRGDTAHHETAKILARYLDPVLALFPGEGDLLVSGEGAFCIAFYSSNSRNLAILTS